MEMWNDWNAPRFPLADIAYWAGRYHNPAEADVAAFAPVAFSHGHLTHAEFVRLGEWKAPRNRTRCESNDPGFVEAVTRVAFSTPDEQLRIEHIVLFFPITRQSQPILQPSFDI